MINPNYAILISTNSSPHLEVYCFSQTEPTNEDLKAIWDSLGLKNYQNGKYQSSDLIEVFEVEQLQEAFVDMPNILRVGHVLTRNPTSAEDAINAYFVLD